MNKIIMVGMNQKTRHLIPWDADAEFWTLNESAMKDWVKRWDVLFQIHPRWDWDRLNNLAEPNHPLFIKGEDGQCLYCKGSNEVYKDGQAAECPWCEEGKYIVPRHRWGVDRKGKRPPKKIIMQHKNKDVTGSMRFPLKEIVSLDGKTYLTSTLAHMLAYAIHYFPNTPIELYGFEAESSTEYAVQRPCIEYWVGYGRGLGMSIEALGSGLLTGKHYAYEDSDQGYRSRLEMRKHVLMDQLNTAEIEAVKSEGALNALNPLKQIEEVREYWESAFDDQFKKKNFVSFLRGTLKELDRSMQILDAYRQDSPEATQADTRRLIELPYQLG